MNGWGNPKMVVWDDIDITEDSKVYNPIEEMIAPMSFIGVRTELPDPSTHNVGDLVICNNITYMKNGNEWEELSALSSPAEETIEENLFSNCRNCGSPLIYAGRCQYCGTPQPTRTIHRRF